METRFRDEVTFWGFSLLLFPCCGVTQNIPCEQLFRLTPSRAVILLNVIKGLELPFTPPSLQQGPYLTYGGCYWPKWTPQQLEIGHPSFLGPILLSEAISINNSATRKINDCRIWLCSFSIAIRWPFTTLRIICIAMTLQFTSSLNNYLALDLKLLLTSLDIWIILDILHLISASVGINIISQVKHICFFCILRLSKT